MNVFAEFDVPVTAFPLGQFLREHRSVTVELERVVPTAGFVHYLWVEGGDAEAVVSSLVDDGAVASADVVDDLPGRTLLRVDWAGTDAPLFDLIQANGATLVGATGAHDGWTVDLRFPDQGALSTLYDECIERGIDVDLRRSYEAGSPSADDGLGLSDPQQETLATAFRAGYFEVPRRTTIEDLAAEMGVSEQAVSERLRRALSTLLTSTLTGRDDDEN
ncbi:helix-turn-helix domain-containing protein [Halorarius halobius]|uniref:helix-turn-helix domain-containing protein n=1 Tax=Halorarius halobius TaxID=2962671 RepID=UPI0020CD4306|nr:helix-turn-helix domain-containing protein [Halorarius halobius]